MERNQGQKLRFPDKQCSRLDSSPRVKCWPVQSFEILWSPQTTRRMFPLELEKRAGYILTHASSELQKVSVPISELTGRRLLKGGQLLFTQSVFQTCLPLAFLVVLRTETMPTSAHFQVTHSLFPEIHGDRNIFELPLDIAGVGITKTIVGNIKEIKGSAYLRIYFLMYITTATVYTPGRFTCMSPLHFHVGCKKAPGETRINTGR